MQDAAPSQQRAAAAAATAAIAGRRMVGGKETNAPYLEGFHNRLRSRHRALLVEGKCRMRLLRGLDGGAFGGGSGRERKRAR